MQTTTEVTFRKLCYILHRGFVEARMLAQLQQHQQSHDLADAFEPIPGFLADWNGELEELVRSHLQTYQNKYQGATFDYLAIIDMDDNHFMEICSNW